MRPKRLTTVHFVLRSPLAVSAVFSLPPPACYVTVHRTASYVNSLRLLACCLLGLFRDSYASVSCVSDAYVPGMLDRRSFFLSEVRTAVPF